MGNGNSATMNRHSWDVVIKVSSFMITLVNDTVSQSLASRHAVRAPVF